MKKVLLFVFIGLLLLAIPATIFYLGQQKDIRAKAAPATTLSISPATQSVKVGDSVKVTVNINPGPNQVVTVKIYLTYDPTKLSGVGATNGTVSPRILNSGIFENGTASITIGATSNSQPITTAGSVAIFTFTALAPTTAIAPADIKFAANTFVGGINDTTANVLAGSTGGSITITGTAATPTPAIEVVPTATPSATVAPTITPTLTPSLTPTRAASGSAEASSSALAIIPPTATEGTVSAKPVIQVKAPPGSTVTIVIHSDPQTCVAVADANGIATCTPDTPLDPGPHDITASIETASGSTETTSESIVVGQGGGEIPVTGSVDNTIILIGIGILFLTTGALLPVFIK